jgi:hypothetical protein
MRKIVFVALCAFLWLSSGAFAFDRTHLVLELLWENYTTGNWVDTSGQGNHAQQSTAGYQPVALASGVYFDGTDDFLQTISNTGIPVADTDRSVFVRCNWAGTKVSTLAGVFRYGTFFSGMVIIEPVDGDGSNKPFFGGAAGGEYVRGYGNAAASGAWTILAITYVTGPSSSLCCYQDRILIRQLGWDFNTTMTADNVRIGTAKTADGYHGYFHGFVDSVLVFDETVGATESALIQDYMESDRSPVPFASTTIPLSGSIRFAGAGSLNIGGSE